MSDDSYKLILLGDSNVGKTSLLANYTTKRVLQKHKPTVATDFMPKNITLDGNNISLRIWDTAGQERFRSLGTSFYRGSHCCILVFSVLDEKSFKNLDQWQTEFLMQGKPPSQEKFPFLVIGNKSDLPGRVVSTEEAQEWCDHHNIPYMETNSRASAKIEEIFEMAARAAVKYAPKESVKNDPVLQTVVQPAAPKTEEQCC